MTNTDGQSMTCDIQAFDTPENGQPGFASVWVDTHDTSISLECSIQKLEAFLGIEITDLDDATDMCPMRATITVMLGTIDTISKYILYKLQGNNKCDNTRFS